MWYDGLTCINSIHNATMQSSWHIYSFIGLTDAKENFLFASQQVLLLQQNISFLKIKKETLLGVKGLGQSADNPPPSNARLSIGRSYTSTSSLCLHRHDMG
jgi:hypothetical protein